jgi:hypothetical protein
LPLGRTTFLDSVFALALHERPMQRHDGAADHPRSAAQFDRRRREWTGLECARA